MITVLADTINPRVAYAVSLVLKQVLHVEYHLTNSPVEVTGYCINYSHHRVDGALCIAQHSLLTENNIQAIDPEVSLWRGLPVFFDTDASQQIPFDIFAASFWLATRYEEYTCEITDNFGRYPAHMSHAFRNQYIEKPVINLWAAELKKEMQQQFGELNIPQPEYRFVPTVDIDSMFKYRYKGFLRNFGGFFRDLFHREFTLCTQRIKVLTGIEKDPWDIFDNIIALHRTHGLYPLFFVLCAKKPGKYDKNISPSKKIFFTRLQELKKQHRIGIHPSFQGHFEDAAWENETNILRKLLQQPVYEARMHYLKIQIPHTYRELIRMGVEFDFSMAYAGAPGFRAGLCSPFFFYDLANETETNLSVVPLGIMDVSMKKYLKLSRNESIALVDRMVDTVRNCGGVFVSLWHNESFAEDSDWNRVYEHLLEKAR